MRKVLITFNVLIIIISGINAQLANFTVDKTKGCDSLTVKFTNLTPGTNTYKWNFGNDSTSTADSPTMKFYAGTFRVRLTVNNSSSKDTTIQVNQSPIANFVDTSLTTDFFRRYFKEQSTLNSSIKYNFNFDFGDGSGIDDTIRKAWYPHLYKNQGTYTVTLIVKDNLGCADTISKIINISDSSEMVIPNVFTPNKDNINDLFIIRSNGITELTLQVFNRWGVKIYENTACTITWDGKTLSGNDAPSGLYYIIVSSKNNVYPERRAPLYLFR